MIIAGDDATDFTRILADQASEFGGDLDADTQFLTANLRTMHHAVDYHRAPTGEVTDLCKE